MTKNNIFTQKPRISVTQYAADRARNDKPVIEIYPWWAVVSIALLWSLLWFGFWALCRGFVASFVVLLGSPFAPRWVAFPLPVQFLLWLACMYSVQRRLRQDQNPSWLTFSLSLLLLMTWPPTAFFMLNLMGQLTESDFIRSQMSRNLRQIMDLHIPDIIALTAATIIGAQSIFAGLRWKYRGLHPHNKKYVLLGWVLGATMGTLAAIRFGTMYFFMITGAIGSAVIIRECRETIRQGVQDE